MHHLPLTTFSMFLGRGKDSCSFFCRKRIPYGTVNYSPFLFSLKETFDASTENDHPRRLQFGFSTELEKLVHEKVESSTGMYV